MKPNQLVRAAVTAAALTALSAACTPSQIAEWQEWYQSDPEAAMAHANLPEVQAALAEASQTATQPARSGGSVWDRVAQCESGQTWNYNGRSGYDGGLQFHPSTWRGFGGRDFAEFAYQASREEQIIVAERVLDSQGWRAWPACSRKLGLR